MLAEKPWRTEAVLRLIFAIFLCWFAGVVVMLALYHRALPPKAEMGFYAVLAGAFGFIGFTLFSLRNEWKLENVLHRAVLALGSFYAALLLALWAEHLGGANASATPRVAQTLIAALSLQGMALILIPCFVREHQLDWTTAFGLQHRRLYAVLLGLIGACLFLPFGLVLKGGIAIALEWASNRLPNLPLKPEEQQAVQALQLAASLASRISLGFVVIVLAPIAEETVFRGVLYPWIKRAGFPRLALWATALLFALAHGDLLSFLPLVLLAVLLTILYERTQNLLASITCHAFFNAMNFSYLLVLQETWSKTR